jgi:hypothetical protein
MSHVTGNGLAWAVCAAILALCPTGCMISPQHGQYIGRTSDKVLFAGATGAPGQTVRIQAKLPYQNVWNTINEVHTSGENARYTDSNGTWYRWPAILSRGYVQIPAQYWRPKTGGPPLATHQAELRAVLPECSLDEGLFTFDDGYRYDPTQDLLNAAKTHGHGQTVTVYATLVKDSRTGGITPR